MNTTFMKGKTGGKQVSVLNEQYTCNIRKGCPFHRYADKLHTAVGALRDHVIITYKVKEGMNPVMARNIDPSALQN